VGGDVSIDNDTLLVIDFVNLKIKLTQSFRDVHKDKICIYIYKDRYLYVSIYIYTMFLKNNKCKKQLTRTQQRLINSYCRSKQRIVSRRGTKDRGS
jgi:hypothetical protein